MRVGAFELQEIPSLKETQALVILRPWVDVGRVGSQALSWLEARLHARELGRLKRPGTFFDFTRYRPVVYFQEGRREVAVPNASVSWAERDPGPDLLFLHLWEPHAHGELYVESVLKLLEALQVKRYFLVGAMYDVVPHTRPLRASGLSQDPGVQGDLLRLGVSPSSYQGPTSITVLVSQEAPKRGIPTGSLIVHLPQYAQLEEDYTGCYQLLRLVSSLLGLDTELEEVRRRGEEQYQEVSRAVAANSQLQQIVKHLETFYDSQETKPEAGQAAPQLSPEVEGFLREMERRFRQN